MKKRVHLIDVFHLHADVHFRIQLKGTFYCAFNYMYTSGMWLFLENCYLRKNHHDQVSNEI